MKTKNNKFSYLQYLSISLVAIIFLSCSSTNTKKINCSLENKDFLFTLFKHYNFDSAVTRKIKCSYSKSFIKFESSGVLEFIPPEKISLKLFSNFGNTVAEVEGTGKLFKVSIMNSGLRNFNISKFNIDAFSVLAGRPGGLFSSIPKIDSLYCKINGGVDILSKIPYGKDSVNISLSFDAEANLTKFLIPTLDAELEFLKYYSDKSNNKIPALIKIRKGSEKISIALGKTTLLNK